MSLKILIFFLSLFKNMPQESPEVFAVGYLEPLRTAYVATSASGNTAVVGMPDGKRCYMGQQPRGPMLEFKTPRKCTQEEMDWAKELYEQQLRINHISDGLTRAKA